MLEPSELRPKLDTDMPRLPIDRQEARDIASYLTRNAERPQPVSLAGADPQRGRQLFQDKECGKCHVMTGVEGLQGPQPPPAGERVTAPEIMLAPDLRHARERLDAGSVVAWVMDPLKVKPGTLMEKKEMTVEEARHLAAFVLTTPLGPAPTVPIPPPPKPLDRPVTYDEVAKQVLGKTCTHCHGNPDIALGDGGPGNSGGLGFKERGLELTSYERVAAGILDDQGERQSIFTPMPDGTSRLVASLLARYSEVAGKPIEGIRGMPLGLPPLPMADIQLLATWVAQGRPR
jgi:mono/diheme cytochrome c family protein